jgi:hypothetical protein
MTAALAHYGTLGFHPIARYPESEDPPEVEDLLVYLELVLESEAPGLSPV